jgi:uncharacterized protein
VKLHATASSARNVITAYGEDYVAVNGVRHASSLIVLPESIVPWRPESFDALKSEDFEALKALQAEIILLGTGAKQRFPDPRLTAPLASAGIGVEVMDLKAACRTFNILAAEERKVAAALLLR